VTLGFTVEALLPAGRGGGTLSMGLRRVPEPEWLQSNPDRSVRTAAFAADPDTVQLLPAAQAAGHEVAAMLGVTGGLAEAARSCWEDLCLLLPDADGQHRLVAGAVAFPTDWRLADKMGLPLTGIHAPIHGYAEQLAAGVDHFFATLAPGPIFGRANWFVVPSPTWRYLPQDDPAERFAHVTAANAGRTLFVRCERQTLRRLPQTGAVLFTIGVHVAPLGSLSPDAVRRVSRSVAAVPTGEHERRAAPFYAEALAGYAQTRDQMEPVA
jgi:dimethylamine monooxygenase subunit A